MADVAQAIVGSIDHDKTIGRCYELGGRAQITLRQLAERVLADNGKRARVYSVPSWLLRPVIDAARILKIRPDWDVGLLDRAQKTRP